MGQGNRDKRSAVEKDGRSARGIRPAIVLCLMTALVAASAFGARAAFYPSLFWPERSHDVVAQVASKEEKDRPVGYVWSAARIDSGLRLRGAVPSEEDRQTLLGMVKAHFPDLKVEEELKVVDGGPPRD
jgi:hypothetical protein